MYFNRLMYTLKYDKQDQQETQPPPDPATIFIGKWLRRTPNKNRTGHKAEHGQANH
jgi:hypothetical protein